MGRELRNFILHQASRACTLQCEDGSMPAGHNGPYFHRETNLRNTCHWMITWCNAHAWTGDTAYMVSARRALAYILLPHHRPYNANWLHRHAKGRDRCNGLIGPAWVIEALVCAIHLLGSDEALMQAKEVFALHPFDEAQGMWKRVEVDGTVLSFDRTFNHQLWFAASAARLSKVGISLAAERTRIFLDRLQNLFSVSNAGLIRHRIRLYCWDPFLEPGSLIHKTYLLYDKIRCGAKIKLDAQKRDFGYHAFNLHAFAVLHRLFPQHEFWDSKVFMHAIDFGRSQKHRSGVDHDNPYGYPYNPVGFEMALALQELFPEAIEERRDWIRRQIATMTRSGTAEYGMDAEDPATARARLYEAVDLDDIKL